MKIRYILLIAFLLCAAGILLFSGFSVTQAPADEEKYPYPISFLKIDAVSKPDASYRIITLTEADKRVYPVLTAALENGETYLNIHPDGEMTAEEYYAIDSFEWESYVSFAGSLYHVSLGAIGLAPKIP